MNEFKTNLLQSKKTWRRKEKSKENVGKECKTEGVVFDDPIVTFSKYLDGHFLSCHKLRLFVRMFSDFLKLANYINHFLNSGSLILKVNVF
jgi:hypothetical protein